MVNIQIKWTLLTTKFFLQPESFQFPFVSLFSYIYIYYIKLLVTNWHFSHPNKIWVPTSGVVLGGCNELTVINVYVYNNANVDRVNVSDVLANSYNLKCFTRTRWHKWRMRARLTQRKCIWINLRATISYVIIININIIWMLVCRLSVVESTEKVRSP